MTAHIVYLGIALICTNGLVALAAYRMGWVGHRRFIEETWRKRA